MRDWTDFLWQWRFLTKTARTTPPTGSTYQITKDDFQLSSTSSTTQTWTLPAVTNSGQILKIKNKGAGEIVLNGTVFTSEAITSLILLTGDMVTLTDDGTYWSVGD